MKMSPKKRKAAFELGEIGDRKLSEVTVAKFLQAMPYIDTVPLPDSDLGVVKVKELFDPEWQFIWREEKKKMERELLVVVPSDSDIAVSQRMKVIEEKLAKIEKQVT